MGHEHSHYHLHSNKRSTQLVVVISFFTMLAELYYGYEKKSVALSVEGWHMLSHVLVLGLAWLAYVYLTQVHREHNQKLAARVLSLSAFGSAIVLLLVTIVMLYESGLKMLDADIEPSNSAILVAIIGLLVNGVSAYLLHREEEHRDLNMHAAYLHVLSDVVISIFAIVALVAARCWGIKMLDPILGMVGALIILRWAVGLIHKSWKEVMQ